MFPHYTMYLLAVVTFIMVAYSSILDFRVEPGTSCYKEPKFIVFFTKLLCLFSLFCFKCKRDQPNVTMKQRGTMVIVNQHCMICGDNSFSWKSQPMMFNGRYPAGNVLLSFSILMAGALVRFSWYSSTWAFQHTMHGHSFSIKRIFCSLLSSATGSVIKQPSSRKSRTPRMLCGVGMGGLIPWATVPNLVFTPYSVIPFSRWYILNFFR